MNTMLTQMGNAYEAYRLRALKLLNEAVPL
jgi:hypothetical protein